MKLPADLHAVVDRAAVAAVTPDIARRAVSLVDLTSLGEADTAADVERLCARAVTPAGPVAAVCVWPRFVPAARAALEGAPVRVATVVNFPTGEGDAAAVSEETRAAITHGADEVDVVLPYRAFIDGGRTHPLNVLRACREACGRRTMKVILETGAFGDPDLIAWAARDAIAAGADFLKTSTGKIADGATPEAAALLLSAVHESGRPVGVKVSGGVRDAASAAVYLDLADAIMGGGWALPATFRFGASALLESLLTAAGEHPVARESPSGY